VAKTVAAAYAEANLPALLNAVAAGQSITILRYNKPVADLIPSTASQEPAPQFGTGRGKWKSSMKTKRVQSLTVWGVVPEAKNRLSQDKPNHSP
jgi:antitoxin (DNA-binding transcriptional repressor) of toxin-antitoxin stability system